MVPWSHWRQPFLGWMLTVLTSEFTHFNLVIRLSNVQQLALLFCTFFENSRGSGRPRDPSDRFLSQREIVRNNQKLLFCHCSNFCSIIASCHDIWIRQAHVLQVWYSFLLVLWWGETYCAPNSLEFGSRFMPLRLTWTRACCGTIARILGLGTESCVWFFILLLELCIRGLLLRRLGPLHRSRRLLLRRGHHQRRLHICLDNPRHCSLHGLLRPHSWRLLQPHHHCRSLHWLHPLMQYQLHILFLQRLHLWFPTPLLCTPLHRPLLLPQHQLFQLHGTLLQLHLTHRPHHLHLCRAHRIHLVPFILHHWQLQLQLPQPNLDILQSRPPRSFDLRRNLTNYAVLLQKLHRLQFLPHRRNQRQHLHHPSHRN